ncbi:MAG TPA: phytanoyl-CoA dioxygenase family protein [Acidimicrobiales bacterium]|nr:phytanoyl-CoA dioxygenase family protein [Acidimicrobiales bacterium]
METEDFQRDGFVVLPGYLSAEELAPALAELPTMFPSADDFHRDADPLRNARFRDEFGGITNFPFLSTELSLVAVHDRLVDLAGELLGDTDLRVYSIEGWAKYTGAASYDQSHHRDYLNHSLVVPSPGARSQVEMFLYLSDVTSDLGAPSYVPHEHTRTLPALPNWLHRVPPAEADERGWVSSDGWPSLYDNEVSAAGPAGTVVAYTVETFHRGTELTRPNGARYTIHVNFRRADSDWIGRRSWTDTANSAEWHAFVARASMRQLQLFGFPPPEHPYWTEETIAETARRYPGFGKGR